MANYTDLKAAIAAVIKANGNNEITGTVLQNTLLTLVGSLGQFSTFAGVASPTTNPGSPDGNVFYLAFQEGQYVNFGGYNLPGNAIAVFDNKSGTFVGTTIFSNVVKPYLPANRDTMLDNGVFVKSDNNAGIMIVGKTNGTITRQLEILLDSLVPIIRTRQYVGGAWSAWVDYISEINNNKANSFTGNFTSASRDTTLVPGVYAKKDSFSSILIVSEPSAGIIKQTEFSQDQNKSIVRYRTRTGGVWSAWVDYISDLEVIKNSFFTFSGYYTEAEVSSKTAPGIYANKTTGEILRVSNINSGRYSISQEIISTAITGVKSRLRYYNNQTSAFENWFEAYNNIDVRKAILDGLNWKPFSDYSLVGGYIAINTKEHTASAGQSRTTPIPISSTGKAVKVNIGRLTTGVLAISYYNSDVISAANYVGMEMLYGTNTDVNINWLLTNIPETATHFIVSNDGTSAAGITISIPSNETADILPEMFYSFSTSSNGVFRVYSKMSGNNYAEILISKFVNAATKENLWRINGGNLYKYISGALVTQNKILLTAQESEFVFKETGKSDFTGGYHGDEILTEVNFFVDNLPVSLSSNIPVKACNSFRYRQISNMLETDTSEDVIICKHVKMTEVKEGGYLTKNRLFDAQRNINIQIAYFGISCISNVVAEKYYSPLSAFITPTKTASPGVERINELGVSDIFYFSETDKLSAHVNSNITKALKANGTDNTNDYNFNALMVVWDVVQYQKYYRRLLNKTFEPGEVWEGECFVKFRISE